MGVADLFRKRKADEVTGARVLVASLNPKFSGWALADRNSYLRFYAGSTEGSVDNVEGLREAVKGYDAVHLFCDVSADGDILDSKGGKMAGAALLKLCGESGVKLLWIASSNPPGGYVKGFKAAPLNLVTTIDRTEANFTGFLETLLSKLSSGQQMPAAWVAIAPQAGGSDHRQSLPSCIFVAGRGSVILR